jgi:hypothetical protein
MDTWEREKAAGNGDNAGMAPSTALRIRSKQDQLDEVLYRSQQLAAQTTALSAENKHHGMENGRVRQRLKFEQEAFHNEKDAFVKLNRDYRTVKARVTAVKDSLKKCRVQDALLQTVELIESVKKDSKAFDDILTDLMVKQHNQTGNIAYVLEVIVKWFTLYLDAKLTDQLQEHERKVAARAGAEGIAPVSSAVSARENIVKELETNLDDNKRLRDR